MSGPQGQIGHGLRRLFFAGKYAILFSGKYFFQYHALSSSLGAHSSHSKTVDANFSLSNPSTSTRNSRLQSIASFLK
ncbi:MAG: hypothetical protein WCG25_06460 [bacterium]